ncbi:MAG: arsenate reductase family protein [Flavobacteriales bacterium]|jgi:arsenate reductase|tara:strand:+ start:138 stop:488 length:351 start_codon:yes stop_codon:yes gene_type:complete
MKKIYYLSTCDTNKRILKELSLPKGFMMQDLKTNPISEKEVEELYHFSKSYETLINKRARLYNERNLKNKTLKESNYKKLLLEHYTFLKRPVLINENEIFIGNSKKVVAAAKESLI